MNIVRFYKKTIRFWIVLFCILALHSNRVPTAQAQSGYDPTVQTPALLYNEARTVYLGNIARQNNGVPPLRWNRQLTYAARWFSWDSTENRSNGFCGHQDTQGHFPNDRALAFGYLGLAGAENAYCGYLSPQDAIDGWMKSSGHRANLLDPNSREIGLGYYRRDSDGHGYVTQDFGNDAVYAPVVIENEAISTSSPNVNLYIYDRSTGCGLAGFGAATQMMVSNDSHFSGASWEPYNANKAWTLANGAGWRDVYVKTRDAFGRTMTSSDAIYLGPDANVPLNEIGTGAQMSTTQSQVTLYDLNGGTLPQVQLSLGWLADDTFSTFGNLWGNGERVNDAAAQGGTAYRLYPGNGESSAWVWDTSFIKDVPMVAYFRLKVNDNTSNSEVARVSIDGGGTTYGPLSLRGTDFSAPNQYQEFALNFTFNSNPNDDFLIFQFWRSGNADVYVDSVSIFSAPQAITSPIRWSIPGGNYRGQGVWVRYTNGIQFSEISEGITTPYTISGNSGVGGAMLSYNDGSDKTIVADANGNYSIPIPYGWSGTVTPSRPCYVFNPANKSYNNVISDQTAQNYTAVFNAVPACADATGVFRPSNGLLYLKNQNTTGFADVAINYGIPGDYPVVGDWDGNGTSTIGVYRSGKFYLRNLNSIGYADIVFAFGQVGDQPIAGDWDGDGKDTIGVYRPSTGQFLLRNSNSVGPADASFYLGNVGDVGIAGDWNGDGKDTTGVFRPSNGVIFLKNTNMTGFADIALNYGIPGDKPIVGDWNNDGVDTIGVYRNGIFYLRDTNTIGFADYVFGLGNPGDMPLAGDWDGLP